MTINRVATVCVFVSDQDRAKAFYTEQLGLQLRADEPLFPGAPSRWLAVAPAGSQCDLILYLPDANWDHYRQVVGKSQAITLDVSDMAETAAQLKGRGVMFVQEPDAQPWGTYATIEDSVGNHILLVEQPAGRREFLEKQWASQ
jgi:lactoylglutathione lyase